MKKILVVVESIDVEDSSGSKANVALIQNLHKAGFELLVYHYTRKEIQLSGIPCVSVKEKRWTALFFLSRLERYIRTYLKLSLSKPLEKVFGFSFTLFNDRNSIIAALKKMEDFNPNLVLTLSKGGSFRPHHALLKMPKWHHIWMAYIHDPYPMYLYPPPFAWPEPGSMAKWKFVRNMSEKAAFSAFPSKLLMDWMVGYFPNFQKCGVVIPHQIVFEKVKFNMHPKDFDPAKFNLLHAGTLLGPRNPEFLLEAYLRFLTEYPEAQKDSRLFLVGNTELHDLRIKVYRNLIPKGCFIVKPQLEFNAVLSMQNLAIVNIILEAKSQISPFLPGKFPHCLQAGKPILLLGPNNSESRRLMGDDYAYWAENDDIEKIAQLLKQLYESWIQNKNLTLDKPELSYYLSSHYLGDTINKLVIKN